jgi:hypothetical protein
LAAFEVITEAITPATIGSEGTYFPEVISHESVLQLKLNGEHKMFRRLCREAVIFMLLGLVVAAVSSFVYMHHSEATSIQGQRDALKKNCDLLV